MDDMIHAYIQPILEAYIAGEMEAAEAALQLTAPVARCLLTVEHDNSGEAPTVEGWLWSIWGAVMYEVRRVAYNHPALDALVALLAAIKQVHMPRTCTPASDAFERAWGVKKFWQDLPVFGPNVREDWNSCPDHHPEWPRVPNPDSYSRTQWASMNAFVARLSVAHVMNFYTYGIWTMRDAFEEGLGPLGLDNHVPAAAVWVLDAGSLMYDLAQKAQPPDGIANASNGGPLWKGQIWYSLERWAFWKQGFSAAMGSSELDGWTKEMAAMAHQKMEQIEQQESRHL